MTFEPAEPESGEPGIISTLARALNVKLFSIGETPMTISTLATVLLILIVTFIASKVTRTAVERIMSRNEKRPQVVGTVTAIVHYCFLIIGFGIALQTAGINLSALFAAGAFFAVALGFAMQSITQNFVSGIILLSERSIKPGDILEVEGRVVRVREMGIRASTAQTRDGEDLIVPNGMLSQTMVTNYTLKDSAYRIRVPVGVTYSSDMAKVRSTLEEIAAEISQQWVLSSLSPNVFMTAFGDSSVNFEVAIWIDNPWERQQAISRVLEAIWWRFQEKNIVIAFPQLDVHFDPQVEKGLSQSLACLTNQGPN